jgi:sterol desaturase/sphingolipid hydroxylase (fatty acid hydroxylase superfamily)
MMFQKEELYQAVTLIVVVLLLDFVERRRPAFAINRYRELSVHVLVLLLIVFIGGELCRAVLFGVYNALNVLRISSLTGLSMLPSAVKIPLALILGDFSAYWVHRLMHRSRLFWRTHDFHHTIAELWWLSGTRVSLTHLFLFAAPQVLIGYFLLVLKPWEAGVAVSIGVIFNIWDHANFWASLGPLGWLFITPNYHRIHHLAKGLSQKNLGFVFTLWDRMFGTYINPESVGKDFVIWTAPRKRLFFYMILGV